MLKSDNKPSLKINRFLLIGKRKDYDLPIFNDGLNIIHGSTDTGKSMILRLISYALGKKTMSKIAPEVQESCSEIALELIINGETISIKRDIHNISKTIGVYYGGIEKIKGLPDEEYHIIGTKKYRPISEFLLKKLAIPELKVPYAPNNANKGYNLVSIRDIINLFYLTDEELGNMNFLGRTHPNKHIKFIESLKALLKVEDLRVNNLQKTRGEKLKLKYELIKYTNAIKKFFLDTGVLSKQEIIIEMSNLGEKITGTSKNLLNINNRISEKSNISRNLNNEILSKKEVINSISENLLITKNKIREFYELLDSYRETIGNKKAALELDELLIGESKRCPHCNELLEELSTEEERKKLRSDIEEVNHRINDLGEIIRENEILSKSMENNLRAELHKLKELEEKNSDEIKAYISPVLEERDKILLEKGSQEELRRNLEEKKKMIGAYEDALEKIDVFNKEIRDLDSKLYQLKKELREKDQAVKEISNYFKRFIESVGQMSADNPHLDNNFIPRINSSGREVNYYQVAGTAKKVVLCVAYYTALLEYSLTNETFLPGILIVDSPSTGRGSNPEDPTEEVDIEVYNAMFNYWKKLAENFKTQIIIVDHTMPPENVREHILVTFDKTGKDGQRKGLIDDLNGRT